MKYENPIIKGFNPDPSICRVENDYYLATSSFEYFPGIPVYHSTDLVNWELTGNAISRKEQLPLSTAKSSGGIWAPTIRYNDGTFYITATFDGMGNFIISSKNPSGEWSDPVWVEMDGIDPSMYFEDGRMYYCANDIGERHKKFGQGISMAQMNPETGEIIGEIRRIWQGVGGGWIEAPHIYRIGEYYYIIAAEGGTGAGHHEVLGRSKSMWGPYENCPDNPILTNRNDCSKQISCSGHGDLVDDKNGNWWMVHLGTRDFEGMTNLGRETFLMPLIWENGWFKVGENKRSQLSVDAPIWNEQKKIDKWSADFNSIEKQWLFRRIPCIENYTTENGVLTLTPSKTKLNDNFGSPTLMAVRPMDKEFCAETEFEFNAECSGDCAGVVIYLSEKFYYRIYKKRTGNKNHIVFERQIDDINVVNVCGEAESERIRFRVRTDGRKYFFEYFANGNYKEAGNGSVKYLSTNIAGKCFTGDLVGIFAECDVDTTAQMRVFKFGLKKRM